MDGRTRRRQYRIDLSRVNPITHRKSRFIVPGWTTGRFGGGSHSFTGAQVHRKHVKTRGPIGCCVVSPNYISPLLFSLLTKSYSSGRDFSTVQCIASHNLKFDQKLFIIDVIHRSWWFLMQIFKIKFFFFFSFQKFVVNLSFIIINTSHSLESGEISYSCSS